MALVSPVLALLLGNVLLVLGTGLQSVLVPVRAHVAGFVPTEIGIMGAAYYVGFVAGCLGVPYLVKRVGHSRTFAVLAVLAAQAFLAQGLFEDPWVWIPLRAVTGLCFAGLTAIIESWINEKTDNAQRGQTFAIYMTLSAVCSMMGQMLLPMAEGWGSLLPFAVVCLFISLSVIPLAVSTAASPKPLASARPHMGELLRAAPVSLIGCAFVGLGNGAFWSLAPLFVQMKGLPGERAAVFMAAAVLGGAIGHYPIGRISDRIDRRYMLLACALGSAATALVFGLWTGASEQALLVLASLFGLFGFALYPISIAHANDRAGPDNCMNTATCLSLVFGFGAVVGPAVAALLMDRWGGGALFLYIAAMHVGLVMLAAWRMIRRPPKPISVELPELLVAPPLPRNGHTDPRRLGLALTKWKARSRADDRRPLCHSQPRWVAR